MKLSGIIWLEEIVEKIEHKHRVTREEVREVLNGSSHFRFVEKGHRRGENVYSAMGQTSAGRYLPSVTGIGTGHDPRREEKI